jgi:endonuclease YncB( thermonuclease family)
VGFAALGLGLCLPLLACADEELPAHSAAELRGRVIEVVDGDSLTLRVDERPVRVRLAQIDAPERGQPWWRRSRRALAELGIEREARVEVVDVDAYGRVVGEVYVAGRHLNAEMVRLGHAWAYTRYARSLEVVELENRARRAGVGLWALPEAQREPPWLWRRRGGKAAERRCAQMRDCEEAYRYLEHCGGSRIDGDGDGVPCEELCAR